ncbi:MAG: hypothetical protein M5U34_00695 [Chloroflexi bacterium]|nr:hypothetical protein [Chloroflexota bacterium]
MLRLRLIDSQEKIMQAYNRPIKLSLIVMVSIAAFAGLFAQLNQTAQAAPAAQIDVCATCTYTTIQTAVSAANSGDTIRVAQGAYTGMMSTSELTATVVLTKDLVLLGAITPIFRSATPKLTSLPSTRKIIFGAVF